jgi:hypothetical protein
VRAVLSVANPATEAALHGGREGAPSASARVGLTEIDPCTNRIVRTIRLGTDGVRCRMRCPGRLAPPRGGVFHHYGIGAVATTCCWRFAGFEPSSYVLTKLEMSDEPLVVLPK